MEVILLLRNPSAVPVTSARASVLGPQGTSTAVSVEEPRVSADRPLLPGGQLGLSISVSGGSSSADAASLLHAASSSGSLRSMAAGEAAWRHSRAQQLLEFRICVEYTGSLPVSPLAAAARGKSHEGGNAAAESASAEEAGEGGGSSPAGAVLVRSLMLDLHVHVVPGAMVICCVASRSLEHTQSRTVFCPHIWRCAFAVMHVSAEPAL